MMFSCALAMTISVCTYTDFRRRNLATDRGCKERVCEDMLVRLLDAFVWGNHDSLTTFLHPISALVAP